VVGFARFLGPAFARIGQAPVIGEMVAGIALGPSILGRLWPAASGALFPPHVIDLLGLASPGVPFTVFALFSGVSLSVTAFPVLVRILGDLGIQHTRLGVLALSCAAVDDVSAWLLLAALTGLAQADGTSALRALGLTLAYVAVMWVLVRPRLERLVGALDASGGLNRTAMSVGFLAILASALVTEWIGIQVTPHDSAVAEDLRRRLEDLVVVLALPVFFAYTGLRTRIGLAGGSAEWLDLLLIVAVATLGKVGGSFVAARGLGLPGRGALALGILMNTRGLMELIVLNVGLDLGVLSPELFSLLVIMAVATTVLTTPLVRPLVRRAGISGAGAWS
jgi:Kef-type K+ transport system membrane component KefB